MCALLPVSACPAAPAGDAWDDASESNHTCSLRERPAAARAAPGAGHVGHLATLGGLSVENVNDFYVQ